MSSVSSSTATPRITPISFGASGPERANVKNTTTITAPAALITLPEPASPSTSPARRSPVRSSSALTELSRNTV